MRLIDADSLKAHIAAAVLNGSQEYKDRSSDLFRSIDSMPTAYDVDKVVERLEQYAHSDICESYNSCPYRNNNDMHCENCGAMGALEIVKSGDIEWKR